MIRKLSFLVLVTAFIVAACGRQVTPDRPGQNGIGLPPGTMQIKFRTAVPMDFTNVRYVIVFNTSGTGGTPYANAFVTNYLNYSFMFVVGGNGTAAGYALYQIIRPTSGPPALYGPLQVTPQQVIFNPNSNGLGTEFSLVIQKAIFTGIITPSPSAAPTSTATATATPTPSPSPTASASGSPSPSPSPTPSPTPPPYATTWYYNFFTTSPNGTPIDALSNAGAGPNDTSYQGGPLDTSQPFDVTITQPASATSVTPQSAQISGGELTNSPP